MTYEVLGTYGGSKTPCNVLVYEKYNGLKWYVVEGSINVNATYDEIEVGVDVEYLNDVDMFTASEPIEDVEQLESEVDEL